MPLLNNKDDREIIKHSLTACNNEYTK